MPEYAKDVHADPYLLFAPSVSKIRYEPLGVALIYSAWNFPYFTSIKPLITCITAGNCAVMKPSEMSPNTTKVLVKLFHKYMDPDFFQVVTGD